jgi:hypothetical protein
MKVTHGPERFMTDVGGRIGDVGDIEGIVPLDIKTKLFDSLVVGEIMHLLENHQAHHGIEFLGATIILI